MPPIAWALLVIIALVFGLAVLEGYCRGREMQDSAEGSDRLH